LRNTFHSGLLSGRRHLENGKNPCPRILIAMAISKERLYTIIFEADTPEGKIFDEALIFVIRG